VSEGRAPVSLAHASGFLKRTADHATIASMPSADELRTSATALHRAGDYLGAAEQLSQAIALSPHDATLHCDLAVLWQLASRWEQARLEYLRATQLDPAHRAAWYNLGCLYNTLDREAEAVDCFCQALQLNPAHAASHHNLGQALFNLGETDAAIAQYRRAVELGGGALPETTLAMSIGVSPSATPAEILKVRRKWSKTQLPPPLSMSSATAKPQAVDGPPRENRALRVGYVSAFFDRPNWMKPVWALINRHDRERFQLFLYSDGASDSPPGYEPNTQDRWFQTTRLSHVDLAKLIASHELDLLVDLNGFSRLPRLAVFALRPARVQVGWFNMFATTGMSAFDYLIGDPTVAPSGEEEHYCEQIVRVPGCYLTFTMTHPTPDIAPPPHLARGRFTFGSLASLYKITLEVRQAWAAVLQAAPGSRLLLRNKGLRSAGNQQWLRDRFGEWGVAPERLEFLGPADHFQFLESYSQIDLALDTFPYNGGTTTTEALWQGVPVVAIHGDRWTSRVSSSLLQSAGLSQFVARDTDDFIRIAASVANEPAQLDQLVAIRPSLREQLLRSPICDAAGFAGNIEQIYRQIVR
jgi:protein O-GlcNAc transferase